MRGYPVRCGLSIHHRRLWNTGSSAFADDDSGGDRGTAISSSPRLRPNVQSASEGITKGYCMPEFRLTQISDTHLARRHQKLTDNFHRLSEHIDATRPDLVINSGDLAFDAPTGRDDLAFARELHNALPVACR